MSTLAPRAQGIYFEKCDEIARTANVAGEARGARDAAGTTTNTATQVTSKPVVDTSHCRRATGK